MKVSLYKILAVKTALESLNLLAIPDVNENDIESIVGIFVVGLSDRPDEFNNLINIISDEQYEWSDDLIKAQKVLKDFFTLIPKELSVLVTQLKSVSSTLENVVTKMMKEEMSQVNMENLDLEMNQSSSEIQ